MLDDATEQQSGQEGQEGCDGGVMISWVFSKAWPAWAEDAGGVCPGLRLRASEGGDGLQSTSLVSDTA
jgi:hypothetical protein